MELVFGGGMDVMHQAHRLFMGMLIDKAIVEHNVKSILFTLKTDRFLNESRNQYRPYFSYEWRKQDIEAFLPQFGLPFSFAPIDCYQDDLTVLKPNSVIGTRSNYRHLTSLPYPVVALDEVGGYHSSDLYDTLRVAATKSPCHYIQVGAVLVRNGDIITSGFNTNDCDKCPKTVEFRASGKEGYLDVQYTKACNAIHAEEMVLAHAKPGDDIFVTHSPCIKCALQIYNAGIRRVVYLEPYVNMEGVEFLETHNVQIRQSGFH